MEVFLAAEEPIMVQVKRRGDEISTNDVIIEDTSIHNDQDDSQNESSIHESGGTFPNHEHFKMLHEHNDDTSVVEEKTEAKNVKNNLFNSNILSDSIIQLNDQDENSKSEVMFTKTINGQQTTNSKECNDFSESTSTLTINPDAALSEDLLATAINYEVSSYRCIIKYT